MSETRAGDAVHSTLLWPAEDEQPFVLLAARMRPRTFEELVGQGHVVGPGKVLRKSIEANRLPSLILWGPPGSGKTTLAEIIAGVTQTKFVGLSAVSAGVADLRKVVETARKLQSFSRERTILFVDEIHRFNKAQQDAILPHVEDGTITLIGATTENPSFEVNSALLSRCRVFRLEQLGPEDILVLLRRAIADSERGLGALQLRISGDTLERLARLAGGDARIALTALELAVNSTEPDVTGAREVRTETVEDAMQQRSLLYDRAGDMHFDLISAFIKSLRGSDPDAAVYWLARMLEAGEDPMFIARRLVILAAEDVGLADPVALGLAASCQQAVHLIGMPEAYLPLTECALYLAVAPKSNSVLTAYRDARADVERTLDEPVPLHLRNAVTSFDRRMGYGKDYLYAHDFDGHIVDQQYLPEGLTGHRYYVPGGEGAEPGLAARLGRSVPEPS